MDSLCTPPCLPVKRGRGRPPGSKNKVKKAIDGMKKMAAGCCGSQEATQEVPEESKCLKRKRSTPAKKKVKSPPNSPSQPKKKRAKKEPGEKIVKPKARRAGPVSEFTKFIGSAIFD